MNVRGCVQPCIVAVLLAACSSTDEGDVASSAGSGVDNGSMGGGSGIGGSSAAGNVGAGGTSPVGGSSGTGGNTTGENDAGAGGDGSGVGDAGAPCEIERGEVVAWPVIVVVDARLKLDARD